MQMDFMTAYLLHFSEVQDPLPGNLSALAQTGDLWWIFAALLLCIIGLAIGGIFVSKKLFNSNVNIGEAIVSKKGIVVIVAAVLVICCSACILVSNRAIAEENHIDPEYQDLAIPVNANVGNPSGNISVETFKLKNLMEPEETPVLIGLKVVNVLAGNGFEDLHAHLRITDVTVNEVLFDGYMNTMDMYHHNVRLNDDIKVEFVDMNPEAAKSLIDNNGCLILLQGSIITEESYSDTTNVHVSFQNDDVQVSDEAINKLTQQGWQQVSAPSSSVWKKSCSAGTKTQDVLSMFNDLINNEEIKLDNYTFAGWVDDTNCLNPSIPYINKDSDWYIQCCWTNSPVDKIIYSLTLSDGTYDFKLTEKGENVLADHNEWEFDASSNSLVRKDVSVNLNPAEVISIWTSDTVQAEDPDSKAHFNYWSDDGEFIINNYPLWNLREGKLELRISSWIESEEPVKEVAPVAKATEGEVAEASVDEAVTADEAAVEVVEDEAVAVDELPVADQIIDYVTEELPEVVTPLVLMLLWFL